MHRVPLQSLISHAWHTDLTAREHTLRAPSRRTHHKGQIQAARATWPQHRPNKPPSDCYPKTTRNKELRRAKTLWPCHSQPGIAATSGFEAAPTECFHNNNPATATMRSLTKSKDAKDQKTHQKQDTTKKNNNNNHNNNNNNENMDGGQNTPNTLAKRQSTSVVDNQ